MEKVEKGSIVEIKVPNVEKPIKAVVLDVIQNGGGNYHAEYIYILYAQNRLFKAFNCCHWGTTECDEPYEEWSDFCYDGVIIDYCDIPNIPSDI